MRICLDQQGGGGWFEVKGQQGNNFWVHLIPPISDERDCNGTQLEGLSWLRPFAPCFPQHFVKSWSAEIIKICPKFVQKKRGDCMFPPILFDVENDLSVSTRTPPGKVV
ncbi:predicted protein [Coccidioides posadasii str. Silveira]|uniref:Predicted protein n=2 Tax=Coccidioides posadasii TaxID=199306 RepID=E9D960_COCPS|nr:predicted protein [Coccidioides posadasii str. Silveira]KMM70003.1 hypothetical protein CPAG_06315 [Coccidioides posadasii RMSCC 3488]